MKRLIFLGLVAFVCSGATLAAATPEVKTGAQKRYVVLYEKSASPAAAQAAIEGVAPNRVIGTAPAREPKFSVELMRELREATKARK